MIGFYWLTSLILTGAHRGAWLVLQTTNWTTSAPQCTEDIAAYAKYVTLNYITNLKRHYVIQRQITKDTGIHSRVIRDHLKLTIKDRMVKKIQDKYIICTYPLSETEKQEINYPEFSVDPLEMYSTKAIQKAIKASAYSKIRSDRIEYARVNNITLSKNSLDSYVRNTYYRTVATEEEKRVFKAELNPSRRKAKERKDLLKKMT